MFFEQQLEEVGYQYLLAKSPEQYINSVLFFEDMFNETEVQDIFKTTEVFKKLAFNHKDDDMTKKRKQEFIQAYIEILKTAGATIQSIIIKDIDKIFVKDIKDSNKNIVNYFENGTFMNSINAIFSKEDNLMDKVSFIISQGKLSADDLKSLKNIKDFLVDIINYNQNNIECAKYDLSCDEYNYDNIPNIIGSLYESAEQMLSEDEATQEAGIQIIPTKQNTPTEHKEKSPKTNKILSLEDALDKNFENLIGLKDVKNAILGKTKLMLKVPNKAISCNFRIVGNPGVGKTTVAEAISKTFFDAGILKSKEFVAINGAQLKAEYIGQTTGRVKEFFKQAHLGTLFLDEVYSLNSGKDKGDSFTQEAITQLMTEIEALYNEQLNNPNDKTLVIMAGYKNKVKELLDENVGFRRRFPNILELRDYNLEELEAIFNMFMKKDGFTLQDKAHEELISILERERQKENFSNAGYVRNLLQIAEENQARRSDLKDYEIKVEDIISANNALQEEEGCESVNKIGFQ